MKTILPITLLVLSFTGLLAGIISDTFNLNKEVDVPVKNYDGKIINGQLLLLAVKKGNLDKVKTLITEGVMNVNDVSDSGNTKLLHLAAMYGDTNIVQLLTEEGADVNAKDINGWTPLHHASLSASLDIVKLLVEKGADIYATNNVGQTPIDLATSEEVKVALKQAGISRQILMEAEISRNYGKRIRLTKEVIVSSESDDL